MGKAFLYGNLSGGKKPMIIVTAPTGSTVTATLGEKVKNATEKDGQWVFKNCDVGEWTITATHPDQEKPATGKVTITEDGQLLRYFITVSFFTAAIATAFKPGYKAVCTHEDGTVLESDTSGNYTFYPSKAGIWTITTTWDERVSIKVNAVNGGSYNADASKFYVYDNGKECGKLTGGYEIKIWSDGAYLAKDQTSMALNVIKNSDGGGEATAATVKLIKLSNCKTVRFNVRLDNRYNQPSKYPQEYSGKCLVIDSNGGTAVSKLIDTSGANTNIALDVTSLNGSYYIAFATVGGWNAGNKLTVYEITME